MPHNKNSIVGTLYWQRVLCASSNCLRLGAINVLRYGSDSARFWVDFVLIALWMGKIGGGGLLLRNGSGGCGITARFGRDGLDVQRQNPTTTNPYGDRKIKCTRINFRDFGHTIRREFTALIFYTYIIGLLTFKKVDFFVVELVYFLSFLVGNGKHVFKLRVQSVSIAGKKKADTLVDDHLPICIAWHNTQARSPIGYSLFLLKRIGMCK